jgi:hypothetical protein
MKSKLLNYLTNDELDGIKFHLAFSALCVIVLLIPDMDVGLQLLLQVLIYNIGLPVFGKIRYHHDWMGIWYFSLSLSIFQIIPDWYLSSKLDVLVFPDDGVSKIAPVSVYMAGLWSIPLFIIIFSGHRIKTRYSSNTASAVVVSLSLLIFGGSEMTMWRLGSWYAQDVKVINHLAYYIIIPEVILGIAAFWSFKWIEKRKLYYIIPVAFCVMIVYLGSAVVSYHIIE